MLYLTLSNSAQADRTNSDFICIFCTKSVGARTAPVRIIVHVRDMARLCVFVIWLAPLCYGLMSCVLLEQKLQNGCLGNSAI